MLITSLLLIISLNGMFLFIATLLIHHEKLSPSYIDILSMIVISLVSVINTIVLCILSKKPLVSAIYNIGSYYIVLYITSILFFKKLIAPQALVQISACIIISSFAVSVIISIPRRAKRRTG